MRTWRVTRNSAAFRCRTTIVKCMIMTDPLAESCCTTASDTPYLELEPCPVRDVGTKRKKKLRLPDAGENGQPSARGSDRQRSRNLIVSFLLMIVIGSGNKIFMKLQTIPMANYPLFLNLLTTFMFIPLSFAYIIPVAKFGLFNNAITPEQLSMPKKPFAVMGALDCLAGIMQTFASVYLPGPLLILLPQAAIPISMTLSRRIQNEKYRCLQYVGAAVVMAGILVVLEPVISQRHAPSYVCAAFDEQQYCTTCQAEMTEEDCLSHRIDDPDGGDLFAFLGDSSSNSTDNVGDDDLACHWIPATESESHMASAISTLIWSLVMILSCIPMTLSSIYKEIALGDETDLDPILVNGYIAVFQFGLSIAISPLAGLTASPPIYPRELGKSLLNGLRCYLGIGSIFTGCNTDEMCAGLAPLFVNVYLLLNVCYNILIIYVIKVGSSNLLWLAMTIMVPIGNLAFSLPFMPGAEMLHPSDLIGLTVILCGLVTYRFGTSIVGFILPASSSREEENDNENDLREHLLGTDRNESESTGTGDDGVSV